MTTLLAIDPGNIESGIAIIDITTYKPLHIAKPNNFEVLDLITQGQWDTCVIEMIAAYGMSVGAEVFDTCVWIGRFIQAAKHARGITPIQIKRQPVKLHHCHSSKAGDANVTQALVDRFAYGQPNHGKGTKKEPGWFYGFRKDIWQAYALAVYAADTRNYNLTPSTQGETS